MDEQAQKEERLHPSLITMREINKKGIKYLLNKANTIGILNKAEDMDIATGDLLFNKLQKRDDLTDEEFNAYPAFKEYIQKVKLGKPNYYLYKPKFPLAVIYSDKVLLVAPLIDSEMDA